MKVGWLADDPGYVGGAELTQREFCRAAPEHVEVIDCAPGEVMKGLDAYVIHNCTQYAPRDLDPMGSAPVFKYVNDLWPHGNKLLRTEVLAKATVIFTSPLHRQKFPYEFSRESRIVPPALDLKRLTPTRQAKRNGKREGTVSVGAWMNPGKGAHLLAEYAAANGEVSVYGDGPCAPRNALNIDFKGPLDPAKVAQTLWGYETFVFLPSEIEPFGRCVVEAEAAGCRVVTNGLVGARHYLEQDRDALLTAAEDFWEVICA